MTEESDGNPHLYVVDYEDDAERKRIEYLFNNWEEGTVTRPEGVVRLVDGVDAEELTERLVSKVPDERVEAYRLERRETDVDPATAVVERTVPASKDAVETFIEYVLSKKKAVLQSAARNEYELYTKKGRATVSYTLSTSGGPVEVRVRIEGYEPAPSFLAEFFEGELADYAASQRSE